MIVLGFSLAYFAQPLFPKNESARETTMVAFGDVSVLVSVSGTAEARRASHLGFPTIGVVKNILKEEGDTVSKGEIIASLGQETLDAEYTDALAYLKFEKAAKSELLRGPRTENQTVTRTNVSIAEENLDRVKAEQENLVENARRVFLSSSLEAFPQNKDSADVAPIVSGSYSCDTEGTYTLSLFPSNTKSGYSYRLSGLESGTYSAYTGTSAALGSCGLVIQFEEGENYRIQNWTISIPNTQSTSYIANLNAYKLSLQQQKNAVEAAEQTLILAEKTQTRDNAPATEEAINQANARIEQAEARLRAVESKIADFTIRAPFDGVITNIDFRVGEVGSAANAITIAAIGDGYVLTARIPEVDITKIEVGDSAEVIFDAKTDETIPATINFISPLSSEIDGVAYYEARFTLDHEPLWMRAGLNADLNILVAFNPHTLIVPKQFIFSENGVPYVYIINGTEKIKKEVKTGLIGNNGYVEVLNLQEGTAVVSP